MTTELILFFVILTSHLIAGGVILVSIGKKRNNNKKLLIPGWILIGTGIALAIGSFVWMTFGTSLLIAIFFITLPLAVMIGISFWFVGSIVMIIKGFIDHKGNKVALGFTLLFLSVAVVVVPIVLINTYGLPIALM